MAVPSYIPLRELVSNWNDSIITAADGESILDRVGIQDFRITESAGVTTVALTVAFADELGLAIPGVDGLGVYLGAGGSTTTLQVEADVTGSFAVRLPNLSATLRLPAGLLKPVTRVGGAWVVQTGADGSASSYEITLEGIAVSVDGDGEVAVTFPAGAPAIALAPAMIGDTGIVIESDSIGFYLNSTGTLPAGAPAGFKGLFIAEATVYLPEGLAEIVPDRLTCSDCYIGTGGFSGEITTAWSPALSGSLSGLTFSLAAIDLAFRQNALVRSAISGSITLPFFEAPLGVDLCIGSNGAWAVALTEASDGLFTLTKDGILSLQVDSLGFGSSDGVFAVTLSGELTPAFGGLDWPTVALKELTIDATGQVRLAGGWLDLGDQVSFDLHGFQIELTRIGFGNETDGSKWVGFSGSAQLVSGLAGARVEGLKITWDNGGDPALSLSGVGIEFTIPETLSLQGFVAYSEESGPQFAGQIKLNLMAIGLEIDAILVIGTDETQTPAFTYFAIYLGVELPAGIPLWATGLGLYGIAGLFSINYTPDKAADESWYEGWYRRSPEGVADLISKWAPESGAFALGGGVTIGTIADNGYTFSGRLLLVIVLPGPIIMLEGKANFLAQRSSLDEDPIFSALAVLDGRAGTLEVGLGAEWQYDQDRGYIVSIAGDVDAYFDFTDASAWHLYLGQKDPAEKRIRALIFTFLAANSYFMIDASQVATGVWVGIDKHWTFGPLSVQLQAWIEGNAALSWKPVQFHGDAWLHGALGLHVFGVAFELTADARLSVDTPSPYAIYAGLSIELDLPTPMDDFSVTAELEWTKTTYSLPVAAPLAEIAVEHLKTSDAWLLPRQSQLPGGATQPLLLPEYTDGEGFIANATASVSSSDDTAARLAAPVVPLDSRPHLTFGRAVHDVALVGVNPQPPSPAAETVGTETYRFSLTAIVLQKWDGSAWVTAAAAPAGTGETALYGSWAAVPAIPRTGADGEATTAQTKLWLWSINPYDYTSRASRTWDDWFGSAHADYPCVPAAAAGNDLKGQAARERAAMQARVQSSLAYWSDEGAVLAPDTDYRLQVQTSVERSAGATTTLTEYAYFRTEGPPGLADYATPVQWTGTNPFTTALSDLSLYVSSTLPADGTRPVFRAYDIGVAFNETYVELMYRLAGRDLGIYLYDSNGRPLRDAAGRLLSVDNTWGKGSRVLSDSEQRWVLKVDASGCVTLDPATFSATDTLSSGDPGQVLGRDLVHTARLTPLLLHEDFSGGSLDGWTVVDEAGTSGASAWSVVAESGAYGTVYLALQSANIYGGSTDADDPVKPGTLLTRGDSSWTDYRLSATIRSGDDDAIGLVFRRRDADNCYRFALDRERRYRRLVKVVGGTTTVLWEDGVPYQPDWDYTLTVEAVGSDLAVYLDGELLCAVSDPSLDSGGIGLYCWANVSARFADIRVDDFSATAPVVYSFSFTTSQFANFHHQVHSYNDETWGGSVSGAAAALAAALAAGADPASQGAPGSAETDAYEAALTAIFGSPTRRLPTALEATRVDDTLWLVESPEPIDWDRTTLAVERAGRAVTPGTAPAVLKLTGADFGSTDAANDETVSLVLRDALDPAGMQVEARLLPGPVAVPDQAVLLFERFAGASGGLLYLEAFGPSTLDLYTIVDTGTRSAPSQWTVTGGHIAQLSNIGPRFTGGGSSLAEPGTMAIVGDAAWTDYRLTVGLQPRDNDPIGVVFRYTDPDNYYRFSLDSQNGRRRLLRCHNGISELLWEQARGYTAGRDYGIVIEACGSSLIGYLNDELLFRVSDASLPSGAVGLYCCKHVDARFTALQVDALSASPVLWEPDLDDLSTWTASGAGAESAWSATGSSILHSGAGGHRSGPGAALTGGEGDWDDCQFCVQLQAKNGGTMGAYLRYADGDNYYRFTMSTTSRRRSLVRVSGGVSTLLWSAAGSGYTPLVSYNLLLRAEGTSLSGYLNGRQLFAVTDAAVAAGQVGLYAGGGTTVSCRDILVGDRARRIGDWRIVDDGDRQGPSQWQLDGEALAQVGSIYGTGGGSFGDAGSTGTAAVAGDSSWTDYRLRVRLRADDDDMIGLLLRYRDRDNCYRLTFDAQRTTRRLTRRAGGALATLWEESAGFDPGVPFTVTFEAVGERLRAYVDGALIFDLTDAAGPASGGCGLFAAANDSARFEWVSVTGPPLDSFADFAADEAAAGSTAGAATWGDYVLSLRLRSSTPGAMGASFRHADTRNFYRFSVSTTYRRLERCTAGRYKVLWSDRNGVAVDTEVALTIAAVGSELRCYIAGVPVCVVTDTAHPTGAIALYAAGNPGVSFRSLRVWPAALLYGGFTLDESFAGAARLAAADAAASVIGTATVYTVSDETAAASAWSLGSGELTQTAAVSGTDAAGMPIGTYVTAGISPGGDYRLSVRFEAGAGGVVGVLWRYTDAGNHYRFLADLATPCRQLYQVVDGTATLLWEDAVALSGHREYVFTADCQGDAVAGYLDGVELFRLGQAALTEGSVGLCCAGGSAAVFREIRLAEAGWTYYHRFGPESAALPAGTRIAVHAGNAAAATGTAAAGVEHCHAAGDGETDCRRLEGAGAASGVHLRVVDPDGAAGHDRLCLPPGDFAAVTARVLRRADGTGVMIATPGAALTEGVCRLRFTYRRDNTAFAAASPVLTQAGDSSDETATVDLPWETRG